MKAIYKRQRSIGVETIPVPGIASPSDVLIRIALAGLCRTDIYVAENRIPCKNPLVLGHEFSGHVEKTGSEVAGLKAGDRVAVMPLFPSNDFILPNGKRSYSQATMMGIDYDGAFSEFVTVPASAVYKLPSGVSMMQGAYIEPVAASLAVLNANINPEQKGLIFGDNRISRLTERLMRARGFNGIEVCDSSEKLPADYYDFIIETLATTETIKEMVNALKPGGRLILKSRQHTPVSFTINTLVLKDITLESVSYGDFQDAINLVADGKLNVNDLFGDVFRLEQYENVFELAQQAETKKLFFSAAERDVWNS